MVKISNHNKNSLAHFVDENTKFLHQLENEKSEYLEGFIKLVTAINEESSIYEKLGIKFIIGNILNKSQKIKQFKYGDGTFKMFVIGKDASRNHSKIVDKISKSEAFFQFTDSTLLFPQIICLNFDAEVDSTYKSTIRHSIFLFNA